MRALATAAAAAAIPIPGPLDGPLPRFTGAPATPAPLSRVTLNPSNPALAPDGRSGSGLAAGNGAASPLPGPLGHGTSRTSGLQFGTCASLAFDARGRLLGVCNGPLGPALRLMDPRTLGTIATLTLPPRLSGDRSDLAGGTHFLVRAVGTLLVPTNARTLVTVDDALRQTRSIDLGGVLAPGERPYAVAAGYDRRDWAVGDAGTVVALPRAGGPPRALALREPVSEDLATDRTGTYVVTRAALYRLRAAADGTPRVVWRRPVARAGTPPAIVARRYVAVADASNPPRVVVTTLAGREVCSVPVFGPGRVTAHLVVAGKSIVVSNAHGYESVLTTEGGNTSTGGIARVVVGKHGCRTAWTSKEISPSAQAVVSRATGLLYTLVKPRGFPDAWNLAALDWRTGVTRFAALAGEGLGHNSEGGAVVLGPDGAAYAGTFGGVVRFRDT
ncbi:MAG TPA: hypothetical protein VFZ89_04590 [Solirubrobacteraceae bacterium]